MVSVFTSGYVNTETILHFFNDIFDEHLLPRYRGRYIFALFLLS